MLTVNEGHKATKFAREIIDTHIKQQKLQNHSLPPIFKERRGVFVTIHTHPYHELRGCIGIPYPVMTLESAIKDAAISSTRDPRFPPLSEDELNSIIIEVTILSKPKLLDVEKPEQYLDHIIIGRDGLIIEYMGQSGLLLPQVPVEYNWDVEEFLSNLCFKAGLTPDTWFEKDAKIYTFSGQIFTEQTPYGEIEEKTLNGI